MNIHKLGAYRDSDASSQHADHQNQTSAMGEGETLMGFLKGIASGKFPEIEVKGEIFDAARRVRDYVLHLSEKSLGTFVDLSIQVNEIAIGMVRMRGKVSETDNDTQSIASSTQEMVSTINEINRSCTSCTTEAQTVQLSVRLARQSTQEAVERMTEIADSVRHLASRIDALHEASVKIGNVVTTVESIARQTNLLALNASIEAARAGEAGKGFAVVANEVKSLANHTQNATQTIRDRIAEMMHEMTLISGAISESANTVDRGQEKVQEAGHKMETIAMEIDGITESITGVAAALTEQSAACNEIANRVTSISEASQSNVGDVNQCIQSMDLAETLILRQLEEASHFEFPNTIVYLAKSDHVAWKKKLADKLGGKEGLSSSELKDHHQCRLGTWYDNQGQQRFRGNEDFLRLAEPHRRVHDHGIQAARFYEAGDLERAFIEMRSMEEASVEVLDLLDRLLQK